jgi:hypothetical protein
LNQAEEAGRALLVKRWNTDSSAVENWKETGKGRLRGRLGIFLDKETVFLWEVGRLC